MLRALSATLIAEWSIPEHSAPSGPGCHAAGLCGQTLRTGHRDAGPSLGARELLEGLIHVRHDDRKVLKKKIRGRRVLRIRLTRALELQQLDALVTQPKHHALRASAHTHEGFEIRSGHDFPGQGLTAESLPVERGQALKVSSGQAEADQATHGHRRPRRFRNIAYSVCDPPIKSRFLSRPPKVRFDTRYGTSTLPSSRPLGSMQCTPSPALDHKLPSSSTHRPSA